jgi:tRNA modification GTPase
VEKAGVERSHKALTISAIAMHIIDASRPLHASDHDLRKSVVGKTSLIALNKIDLPRRFKLPEEWANCPRVEISAKTGQGIEQLKDALVGLIWSGRAGSLDLDVAINERHARALELCKKTLTETEYKMGGKENLEVIAQLLRIGLDQIGEIVGKTTTEDILTKIFSTFCIGK